MPLHPAGGTGHRRASTRRRETAKILEDMVKQDEDDLVSNRKHVVIKAVEQGKLNKIKSFLSNVKIRGDRALWNYRNARGDTPLLIALKDSEIDMILLLCSNFPIVDID